MQQPQQQPRVTLNYTQLEVKDRETGKIVDTALRLEIREDDKLVASLVMDVYQAQECVNQQTIFITSAMRLARELVVDSKRQKLDAESSEKPSSSQPQPSALSQSEHTKAL